MDNKYENSLHLSHLDNYKKYLDLMKIYYDKNSVCPTNNKLLVNKIYKNDKIELKCDNDKFNIEIKLPKYQNLYIELKNLRLLRDTCLKEIKNNIIYEKDIEEFNKNKETYLNSVKRIEKYNNILNDDDKFILKLDKKLIDLKDKLNKIYQDRNEYFKNLEKIDINTKKKIIEIFSKKFPLKDEEIENYRKSLNIKFNNLKYWLLWLSKVKEYVLTIKNYNEEYHYYKSLLEKISEKNNNYMYKDPEIKDNSKKSKNKYKNSKDIKDLKKKTSGKKKIKIKKL